MSATTHKQSNSKRLGFGRACNACRKRKHRCDALEPQCSGCRSRGNACEYSVRATNKGVVQGQEDSLNHGHAIIIDVSPNRSPHPILSPQRSSPPSTSARHTHSASSLQEDRQGSVSREPASSSLRAGAAIELSNPTGYFGNSSAIKFASVAQNCVKDSLTRDENETGKLYLSEDIATLAESSPREDLQRFQLLLGRSEANQLVDAYFARVHLLYPFVHEMSFRSHYEQIWIDQQPQDNAWLAILNMVFAYGCEFCPCPNGISAAQRASEFVEQAKQIILCQVFKTSSLHLTQALLLLCHWLQGALELNEAWNFFGLAIRSAMSIGLHINPRDGGISSTISREIRKRIWWGYFVLDRTLSMKFGRPPSIILANAFDVGLPADVDDQYILDSIQIPRQPNGKPSRITAFIQTIGLSRVIDNVMSMLYLKSNKLDASAGTSLPVQEDFQLLGNMLLLDGQLQSWWNGVPDYLTRSSDSSEGKDLTRQRNVLYIRYVQMRLLLLRPSVLLLGKDKFQDRFLRAVATECAQRCVWAAQETIQLIHGKYEEQQLHSVWYLLHCQNPAIPAQKTDTDFKQISSHPWES
ncbi:hypothetical protein CNMCM6936_009583 [Aspergillus lentulus]|nr:hypothetical protein CNMCM6936_009583 [Aspergillus lentulus]KAF4185608.1 hypothetical protein CNMCM7927_006426 [Aspergillus lentulus]